jgi:glycosyltransferase involved in cell wall biosynthesis
VSVAVEQPALAPLPSLSDLVAGRRIAIVHDWLTGMRGGEKVLESICRMLPGADLTTLVHVAGSVSPLIEGHSIRTSIIQRFPVPATLYRQYLPFFPTAVELLDFDSYDLVISTSHCAAKSILRAPRALHLCYCHTPMRYVWDQFDAYFGPARLGRARSALVRRGAAWLARWDRDTASRVDRFVANSRHVAARISRYYNRPASVVYAPVETSFFTSSGDPATGSFLVVSALVPYKRIDIAIQAAARLNARLQIIGTGPDEARLKALAGPGVEFLGSVSDEDLRAAYRRSLALVMPGEEDFGIAPVESLACGRPVVALGRGGACETIEHGVTGLLVNEPAVDAFAAAMDEIGRRRFDPSILRAHAERFSTGRFEALFREVLIETLSAGGAW